jgi:hypothetical protein
MGPTLEGIEDILVVRMPELVELEGKVHELPILETQNPGIRVVG